MAKISSFILNHKTFSGIVAGSELKKKIIKKFLEKVKYNENHKTDSDFEKSPFQPTLIYKNMQ
jgi:hypothetical protein